MARAILKFNLDNPEDRRDHLRAIKSLDLSLVIFTFLHNTRKEIEAEFENNPMGNIDVYDGVERTYEKFYKILEEYKIDIDELID